MRDDPVVTGLVTRARNGEEQAWDALVERYAPLIWSICRSHRLGDADAGDVGQRVWRQLVDHLDTGPGSGRATRVAGHHDPPGMRTGPARGARSHAAGHAPDAEAIPDHQAQTVEQQLLDAERHAALREAFARLPACCQRLITLLIQDPPAAIRHDQRHAEHPGRQHRAGPPPLPGQAPPRPGHHSTDQRRSRKRGK